MSTTAILPHGSFLSHGGTPHSSSILHSDFPWIQPIQGPFGAHDYGPPPRHSDLGTPQRSQVDEDLVTSIRMPAEHPQALDAFAEAGETRTVRKSEKNWREKNMEHGRENIFSGCQGINWYTSEIYPINNVKGIWPKISIFRPQNPIDG